MRLDQEVRHKSEDIEDAVLLDAVQAIRRRVRIVNREYDTPYIAGYSWDGHTVFHRPASAAVIPLVDEDCAGRAVSSDPRNC
jgi:hypothetical protein